MKLYRYNTTRRIRSHDCEGLDFTSLSNSPAMASQECFRDDVTVQTGKCFSHGTKNILRHLEEGNQRSRLVYMCRREESMSLLRSTNDPDRKTPDAEFSLADRIVQAVTTTHTEHPRYH